MFKIKLMLIAFCSTILILNCYSMSFDELSNSLGCNLKKVRKLKEKRKREIIELNEFIANAHENGPEKHILIYHINDRVKFVKNVEDVEKTIDKIITKAKESGELSDEIAKSILQPK